LKEDIKFEGCLKLESIKFGRFSDLKLVEFVGTDRVEEVEMKKKKLSVLSKHDKCTAGVVELHSNLKFSV
jgi:hypothetical protein